MNQEGVCPTHVVLASCLQQGPILTTAGILKILSLFDFLSVSLLFSNR